MLMALHNEGENGALSRIEETLNDFGDYEIIRFNRDELFSSSSGIFDFFFVKSRILATASYVFLNDNFMPFKYMRFRKGVKVVQLWHGEGAFKRFGLGQKTDKKTADLLTKGNRNLTDVIVTSKNVKQIYAQAFGVPVQKVKAYGSPRIDLFFSLSERQKGELKEKFLELYPSCRGKKIVLYAPTFRDDKSSNDALFSNFPFEKWRDELSGEYALLVRAHPQVGGSIPPQDGFINVSDYPSVSELTVVCDILVTDYSSICMDFAVQNKPTLFYAFDLEYYCDDERGFYYDYESYVPGKTVFTGEELIKAVRGEDFEPERREKFLSMNFDYLDRYSAKRIIEKVL